MYKSTKVYRICICTYVEHIHNIYIYALICYVYKCIALFHSQFGIRLPVAGELGSQKNIALSFFVSVVPPKINMEPPKNGGFGRCVFLFQWVDFQVPC